MLTGLALDWLSWTVDWISVCICVCGLYIGFQIGVYIGVNYASYEILVMGAHVGFLMKLCTHLVTLFITAVI